MPTSYTTCPVGQSSRPHSHASCQAPRCGPTAPAQPGLGEPLPGDGVPVQVDAPVAERHDARFADGGRAAQDRAQAARNSAIEKGLAR
ncbi:hypothetical protein [Streptomyces sp.]|uniref:hypothetical protein n=1 Tax=Streptomyces sp. TaxID=1931 RepID=UPI002F41741D